MGFTEKIAVTLPRDDVRRLRRVEAARHVPFSAVVREAVETWLKIQADNELRQRYRRYYSHQKVKAQEDALTRQMVRGSARHWPSD